MTMERNILLIDDDKEMTAEVSEILVDAGYRVTVANDGLEGDRLLEKNTYDLVLLDLKMSGMDGLTVFKRSKERDCNIKVIIMTATPLGSDLIDSSESSLKEDYDILKYADGIIKKPYNIESMLNIVRHAIDGPAHCGN